MTIIFTNPGELDVRAITTFGLTSKDGQGKIGRFGTGLKYAIATVLRGGGEIRVLTAGEEIVLAAEPTSFRGQEHQQVTLNGEPLPFTTSLGRDWEPWMAFRELYSNALDEGGSLLRVEDSTQPPTPDGQTQIAVQMPAFEAIYFSIEEHFIVDEEPLWKGSDLEIYRGRSQFVFYRGIAAMKLKKPSAFRYNITSYMALTEDRTAQYPFMVHRAIAQALSRVDVEEIARVVTDGGQEYEGTLDFVEDVTDEPSAVFLVAAAKNGINCNATAAQLVEAYVPDVDPNSVTIVSPQAPGGGCLIETLRHLRALGEDVAPVRWVLDPSGVYPNGYVLRGSAIFISSTVFDNQVRMNNTVLSAWAEYRGNDWLVSRLIWAASRMMESDDA